MCGDARAPWEELQAMSTADYNTPIPSGLLTPDLIEIRGTSLHLADGFPDQVDVADAFALGDVSRAANLFMSLVPVASLEAIRTGYEEVFSEGGPAETNWMIFDDLMDSTSLFLTGNTDTVYAFCMLDLAQSGPVVIDVPANCGPSTINDATFSFVIDMGPPGPDRGAGGKYLILGPDYSGPLSETVNGEVAEHDGETYFVAHSPTYVNWVPCRGMLVDGETAPASSLFRNGIRAYALRDKDNPPPMTWKNMSGVEVNTIHSNDASFFEEVHRAIDREPPDAFDPEILGMASLLGIRKGEPFEPSERQREVLEQGVALGNAYARAVSFAPRAPEAYLYGEENGKWYTMLYGNDYRYLIDDGVGGVDAEARLAFYYVATVNTPAMILKMPGVGSQYAMIARDSDGAWLEGDRTYTLRLPPDVPVKNFWSLVAYDAQTRSMLQTPDQPFPSVNSMRPDLTTEPDGSVNLHFSAERPAENSGNWIQLRPGKSWFAIIRLYGPLEPWFDKTWRPGELNVLD